MAIAGEEIADNLLLEFARANTEADAQKLWDRCEGILQDRDANIRQDCLFTLVAKWPKDRVLPDQLIDLALALPLVNETQRFSWRGYLIPQLAMRAPDDAIERIWLACKDLPRRLRIGDSQAWGWHWTYEYPYASAVCRLVARIPEALLAEFTQEADTFFWAAREDIFERIANRADSTLASKIFRSVVRRLEEYRTHDATQNRLLETEGAISLAEPELFLLAREQAACNVIAALAPRLSEAEFHEALELSLSLTDEVPVPGCLHNCSNSTALQIPTWFATC